MIERDYLVIGAGTAGVSVCEGIRQHDKRGRIMLVGNENLPPYMRLALSKQFLSEKDYPVDKLAHHPSDWYEAQKIDLRLNTVVTQFNLDRRLAVLSNGQTVEFKKACLATGSRPLRPQVAGTNLGNIIYLRSIGDAMALREMAASEGSIVVIGSGFIAVEAAAALRAVRCKVSLLDARRGPVVPVSRRGDRRVADRRLPPARRDAAPAGKSQRLRGQDRPAQHPDQERQPLPRRPRPGGRRRRDEPRTRPQHSAEQPEGHARQRVPGNRRKGHLRRGRHRALPRPGVTAACAGPTIGKMPASRASSSART